MEENPHRVSRRNHGGAHCRNDAVDEENRRQRHYNHHTHVDEVKCSGKRCRSWAAAAIADCVALCCCPCAIINLLTLTFVKVPWMIGRRCLGRNKNKNKKKRRVLHRRGLRGKINRGDEFHHHSRFETAEEERKCGVGGGCCGGGDHYDDHRFVVEKDGSLTKEGEEEKTTSSFRAGGDDESRISARVEAERLWLELYQIGHLGFGRVSFTGIQ